MIKLCIDGPLPRKNARHSIGRSRKTGKVRPRNSDAFLDFVERMRVAWLELPPGERVPITDGVWLIDCSIRTPKMRKLPDGIAVPHIDADACISAVMDALQKNGIVDNDARLELGPCGRFFAEWQSVNVTLERLQVPSVMTSAYRIPSAEVRAARAPRPPEELVGALQDRIAPASGKLLSAKNVRP